MSFINRRRFLTAAAGAVTGMRAMPVIADGGQKLLIPTDKPDEFGFRIMWYSPVPPIDPKTYRLKISGLVERPQSLSLDQLRMLVISRYLGRAPIYSSAGNGEAAQDGQGNSH